MTRSGADVNGDLFKALRQLIPGIPEDTTRLHLYLKAGSVPVVECQYHVRCGIGMETHEQKFEIHPINGTHTVR